MNIHVYCTCIRAHILTTIVPKQGFTLKKKDFAALLRKVSYLSYL